MGLTRSQRSQRSSIPPLTPLTLCEAAVPALRDQDDAVEAEGALAGGLEAQALHVRQAHPVVDRRRLPVGAAWEAGGVQRHAGEPPSREVVHEAVHEPLAVRILQLHADGVAGVRTLDPELEG